MKHLKIQNITPHHPLRIVVMIDNLGMGGAQKLLEVQITDMALTHDLYVVNLGPETNFAQSLRAQGVTVVSYGGMRLTDLSALLRLRRDMAAWAPDLIHSHLLYAALVGGVMARLLKVPHVTTLHNEMHDTLKLRDRMRNFLEEHVLRHMTSVVVACGPKIARVHASHVGKTPLVTVANRVRPARQLPPERRAAVRQMVGSADQDILVLAAGRLMPQKGFDILLSAFARSVQKEPRARLLIVGEGPDQAVLDRQIKALGIEDRVRLHGPVSDLGEMLQIADVFVLSSRYEGLPLVLIEALAAALPVVATRVGDVDTVLDEGCGLLVAPDDVGALAEGLDRVLANPDLRASMARAAAVDSRPHTDVQGFVAELKAVYDTARQRYDAPR
jgi:L-malate glycosyltransferase